MNSFLLSPFQGFVPLAIQQHRATPYAIAVTLAGSDNSNKFILKRRLKQLLSLEEINIIYPRIHPGVYECNNGAAHENWCLEPRIIMRRNTQTF